MEITGKVKLVGEEQNVTASYTKRELVITTDEQYPQTIMIEFGQGKCNEYLDKLKVGNEVKVSINIGGREWINPQGETKYFNSIKGWRIEKLESVTTTIASANLSGGVSTGVPVFAPNTPMLNEDADDLPFN